MLNQNDQVLISELERDEGFRLSLYKDTVGKLTIGCGRNLDDVGISEAEARMLLANDIAKTKSDLDRRLPWWRALNEVRQRVLLNMCFNLGIGGLCKFEQTLALIKAGDYAGAADAMLKSKWATQVKGRATRLAAMMRTGTANS
jgi:lysozyme